MAWVNMAEFKRKKEINKLTSFLGNKKVNIVAGLRRSGKTVLLTDLFIKHLLNNHLFLKEEIGVLKLGDDDRNIDSIEKLTTIVSSLIERGIKVLIVDEAQLIERYVKFFSSFAKNNPGISLYITGSNSDILSVDIIRNFKELANPLYLFPLTFEEIQQEKKEYSFEEYMLYGGLPIVVNLEPYLRIEELESVYRDIYELDVKDRLEGKLNYLSKRHINDILSLLASNASPFSPSQVAARFSKGIDRTKFDMMKLVKDIEDVLDFLEKSFLVSYIEVDDFNNATPLANVGLNKKYYFNDNGMRYINCVSKVKANSNCLENAVYLELISRRIKPKGKILLNKKREVVGEIDFNYTLGDRDYHLQVTHTLTDINFSSEIGNLLLLEPDSFKGLVYIKDLSSSANKEICMLKEDKFFKDIFWNNLMNK